MPLAHLSQPKHVHQGEGAIELPVLERGSGGGAVKRKQSQPPRLALGGRPHDGGCGR